MTRDFCIPLHNDPISHLSRLPTWRLNDRDGHGILPHMSNSPKNQLKAATISEMRPERIGRRLMLLRVAMGLKPSEISDMLGIERTYWSRFEGGKRPITDSFAALLVEQFGVSLDWLMLGRWDRLPLDLSVKMREVERDTK
jgi:plasmid maintenance system antidote protein VapI